MKRILRLEKIFAAQYLKQLMEYKADFLVGIIGVFLTQGLNILLIGIIFTQIPSLRGWSLPEIIFIYGYGSLPKGIDHVLTDNLWAVGQRLVRKGEFDKYMTRPISPLIYCALETFQVDGFGEMLIGILLMANTWQTVAWTPLKAFAFIISIPFATLIYTALKIILSSLAFWMKQSGSLLYVFYQVNGFSKYPVTIYNFPVRFLISFIVPFAFTAYYPASFLLKGQNFVLNIGGTVLVSVLFMTFALWIWNKGIAAYESAGS